MAIDIEKELAAAVAKRGERVGAILGERVLLKKVLAGRSMADFETFFERFCDDEGVYLGLDDFPAMFGPWWMSRFEKIHLFWIYNHLIQEFGTLKVLGGFMADKRIPGARRAFFYHAVFRARSRLTIRRNRLFVPPNFWWDNRQVWQEYVENVAGDSPDVFIRRHGLSRRAKFEVSGALQEAMKKDSVSAFEITRQLENRPVSDSLMKKLVDANSVRCFVYMLANHAEKVFKLRSPEEWLFTVCRHAVDALAAAAAEELDRQCPGLVARARDPWGNTPLWYTVYNGAAGEKLRATLLRFGCDPDAENALGLSYRMLRENDPYEMWEEMQETAEFKRLRRKLQR